MVMSDIYLLPTFDSAVAGEAHEHAVRLVVPEPGHGLSSQQGEHVLAETSIIVIRYP